MKRFVSFRCAVRVALASIVVAGVLAPPSTARAGVIYTAGPNQGATPQEYELSHDWNSAALRQDYRYSRADELGLHAVLGVQGRTLDNFFTGITVDDVIVSAKTPGATFAPITFGGNLSGDLLGAGNGTMILSLSIRDASGTSGGGLTFDTNDGSFVDTRVEVSRNVPVGVPFRVTALMELRASALIGNRMVLDFANSFDFDPAAVFGLGSDFTVNSASWGLVDNRLATAAPEPGVCALLGLGLIGMCAARRRRAA